MTAIKTKFTCITHDISPFIRAKYTKNLLIYRSVSFKSRWLGFTLHLLENYEYCAAETWNTISCLDEL